VLVATDTANFSCCLLVLDWSLLLVWRGTGHRKDRQRQEEMRTDASKP
jgi:hypothetical protein